MVCSHCQGAFTMKHNSRTCPMNNESIVGLADCASLFKEPKTFYEPKKVIKTFERLADCASLFKEPKSFYQMKKVTKTFERLADCASLFKEPKTFYEPKKVTKVCSMCGIAGHNKRSCVLICRPCIVHADMPTKAEIRAAKVLSELLC